MGIIERIGNLMSHVVPNIRNVTLQPIIKKNAESGSLLSTDELNSYIGLTAKGYIRKRVIHGKEEWVRGITHANTIEGFWSHFKDSVRGTLIRAISKKIQVEISG